MYVVLLVDTNSIWPSFRKVAFGAGGFSGLLTSTGIMSLRVTDVKFIDPSPRWMFVDGLTFIARFSAFLGTYLSLCSVTSSNFSEEGFKLSWPLAALFGLSEEGESSKALYSCLPVSQSCWPSDLIFEEGRTPFGNWPSTEWPLY